MNDHPDAPEGFNSSRRAARVLVLGHDPRMVLAIARSLGRRGDDVWAGWTRSHSGIARCRYVNRVFDLPYLLSDPDATCRAVTEVAKTDEIDLVLPATDESAYFLHRHRDRCSDLSLGLVNDVAARCLFDKEATTSLAKQLGIPVPDSTVITSRDELASLRTRFAAGVALKPLASASSSETGKQFVRLFDSVTECEAHWPDNAVCPRQLQEVVPGEARGIEFLASSGRLLVTMQHRRLHETSGHGSTYRESMPISKTLLNATADLVAALEYTGVGMCEYRVDEPSGRWVLLEVNGRFWGSLPLAVRAGVDFPWYYRELLLSGREDFQPNYRTGIRCRSLRADLRWLWRRLRSVTDPHGETGWKLNDRSGSQLARDLVRLVCCRDSIDSLAFDDLAPFREELRGLSPFRFGQHRSSTVSAEARHLNPHLVKAISR